MVMSHQELLKKIEEFPIMEKILSGIHLRDKKVSRAGKAAAVMFLPKYVLGQKYQVILIPEGEEIEALAETLEKKYNEVASLKYKLRKVEAEQNNIESPKIDERKKDKEDSLEDEDAY